MSEYGVAETYDFDDSGEDYDFSEGYEPGGLTDELDPFDPEFGENLANLIGQQNDALLAGAEEMFAPVREYVELQKYETAVQQYEAVQKEGRAEADKILADIDLPELDTHEVMDRARGLFQESDGSDAAATAAVQLAAEELAAEQGIAEPEGLMNPLIAEAAATEREFLYQPGGDEVAFAGRWTQALANLDKNSSVRSALEIPDPPTHVAAESASLWTRGKSDEMEPAVNYGREAAEGA